MKTILIATLLILTGCASEQKQCWVNSKGNDNFYLDTNSCQAEGDAGGAYITGGMWVAAAAQRKYNFCMQGKGYYLATCQ